MVVLPFYQVGKGIAKTQCSIQLYFLGFAKIILGLWSLFLLYVNFVRLIVLLRLALVFYCCESLNIYLICAVYIF